MNLNIVSVGYAQAGAEAHIKECKHIYTIRFERWYVIYNCRCIEKHYCFVYSSDNNYIIWM